MTEPPAYRRLADELRADIESGRLAPGVVLPSEPAMAIERGVGRDTVREALALLRSWGLVSSRQGYGTAVREPRAPAPVVLHQPTRISTRMPTAAEQAQWDLDDGVPVLVVQRGDQVDVYPGDRTILEL